ncbi:SIR2 family NAD-dependent protein deacylase [Ligilactobacillus equi]
MDKINALLRQINEADAILVGAASGMSTAAGMDFWYEDSLLYNTEIRYYADKYGFHGIFNGFYNHFESEEEHWGFYLAALDMILNLPAQKPTYKNLKRLLKDKDYHIMTTNQDTLFFRDFPAEKISEIQGSWNYFQSERPSSDQNLYSTRQLLAQVQDQVREHKLPKTAIPYSPVNGAKLIPWARGPEFLEGKRYFEEHKKINQFLGQHQGQKILFLELGVGRMTPMFIQEPFWEMTNAMKQAFYVNINPKDALTHPQIVDRSLLIHEDINDVLAAAVQKLEGKNV